MKEIEQYKAFIESVCNVYGIVDAIQPLQKGLDAMMEATLGMENIGAYEVDDQFLNQMSTDEYESSNADPHAAQQLWNIFDEDFAAANGVDAAYQKALDELAEQGVDTSNMPQDHSEYIAAFGTTIDSDESEQPWMCTSGECALTEAHRDRTTGGNWFGKTLRDQNNYDEKVRQKNNRNLYVPTAEMSEDLFNEVSNDGDPAWAEQHANYWKQHSHLDNKADKTQTLGKTTDDYGYFKDGTKSMGQSGKFGDAWSLADNNGTSTGQNSGFAPSARRSMKRKENEFLNRDMQDQLADMSTDDTDIGGEIEYALHDLCDKWIAQKEANGQIASDAEFKQYVENALANMTIG